MTKAEIAKLVADTVSKVLNESKGNSKAASTPKALELTMGKKNPYVVYGNRKNDIVVFNSHTLEVLTPKTYERLYNEAKKA